MLLDCLLLTIFCLFVKKNALYYELKKKITSHLIYSRKVAFMPFEISNVSEKE